MTKDKLGKDKTTMTAREVAVLIEQLRSQFKAFGEKLSAVSDKIDMTYDEVGRQKGDILTIRTDIGVIKGDIAEIKDILKAHDKRIGSLETIK